MLLHSVLRANASYFSAVLNVCLFFRLLTQSFLGVLTGITHSEVQDKMLRAKDSLPKSHRRV